MILTRMKSNIWNLKCWAIHIVAKVTAENAIECSIVIDEWDVFEVIRNI